MVSSNVADNVATYGENHSPASRQGRDKQGFHRRFTNYHILLGSNSKFASKCHMLVGHKFEICMKVPKVHLDILNECIEHLKRPLDERLANAVAGYY